jgi:dipeptidase D
MVCVGKAPNIEIIDEGGYLRAKESSLGADNGIGVAIMLALLEREDNIECLFTNDEEIGLVGAFGLELEIESPYLLNLDSEDESIYIGCAGGVDAVYKYPAKKEIKRGFVGEVEIKNLPGGHSGVDIHKNIPNAIKELLKGVNELVEIRGGERRNSIATTAKAKVFYESKFGSEVEVFEKEFVEFLKSLPHGVLEFDFEFDVVSKSVNFAIVENERVVLSLRANSNKKLNELKEYIKSFGDFDFEGEYPAWKPEVSRLAEILKEISGFEYKVIHAGLECGVLSEKLKNVSIASIGPVIENPHSVQERVKKESVVKIINIINELLKRI